MSVRGDRAGHHEHVWHIDLPRIAEPGAVAACGLATKELRVGGHRVPGACVPDPQAAQPHPRTSLETSWDDLGTSWEKAPMKTGMEKEM